jgi:hypothetical protein
MVVLQKKWSSLDGATKCIDLVTVRLLFRVGSLAVRLALGYDGLGMLETNWITIL